MPTRRTVFFVSDRTGITAEVLGHSLMTQFEEGLLRQVTLPFVDTPDKVAGVVEKAAAAAERDGVRPVIFSTLIDDELRGGLDGADALVLDFFDTFIGPLEKEFGQKSSHTTGKAHGMADLVSYTRRIDAMNFALANDDGVTTRHYEEAEVVLTGVSRSGKTPTCLYMALHYGVYAANYPLTPEELELGRLPQTLEPHKRKLFGLTIQPERLTQIREGRRPESTYASTQQVRFEVQQALDLFDRYKIPYLDTTSHSIEELSTTILHKRRLKRHL
jgi:[pyruvate, water dikinase]-phosphate phosphotransferase / [pyruvate, water dikinase] kinase